MLSVLNSWDKVSYSIWNLRTGLHWALRPRGLLVFTSPVLGLQAQTTTQAFCKLWISCVHGNHFSIWAIILSGLEWPETCFSLPFPVTPALSSSLTMSSSVGTCKHSNWHHMSIFLCMHLIGRFTLLPALLLCLMDNANIQHSSEPVFKSNFFISYFHKGGKGCHCFPSC